jgi:hypothetical protein
VLLDRPHAHHEPIGDLPVRRPGGEQAEHLRFAGGEGLDRMLDAFGQSRGNAIYGATGTRMGSFKGERSLDEVKQPGGLVGYRAARGPGARA